MRDIDIYGQKFCITEEPSDFWGWIQNQAWEAHTFRFLDKYLTPATTVIDLGAWVGPITLYASRLAQRVHAVEPDPVAFHILAANLLSNRIDNVEAYHMAIMGYAGDINLGSSLLGCSTTRTSCRENSIKVPCKTLREFAAPLRDPLFIKMDVEGAEAHILRDYEFLKDRRPDLYVSLHPSWWEEAGLSTDAVMQTVRKIGSLYKNHIGVRGTEIDLDHNAGDVLFTNRD